VLADPQQAAHWVQTQVVYCHMGGDHVTPETVAKSGFGFGLGSGGTPLQTAVGTGANDMMSGLLGSGMPDINAMMAQAMRGGGMGQPPPEPEGMTCLCVADVLLTEWGGKGAQVAALQPKTYKMRSGRTRAAERRERGGSHTDFERKIHHRPHRPVLISCWGGLIHRYPFDSGF
jgi:hypothetical protein